jgi:glycosyltransferase involved in cell wall biosynthesis
MSVKKQIPKASSGEAPSALFYAGGFAPVGGIENFLSDLSQAVTKAGIQVELLAWDGRSRLWQNLRQAGVRTFCSPWRWGCCWAWPDWLLLPVGLLKCRKASVVLFGKTFRPALHKIIDRFGKSRGRRQLFVYVTPYRPSELWGQLEDAGRKKEVKLMLNTFDLIICQSSVFEGELRGLGYRGAIEVLPYLPPSPDESPAPYPAGPITIGFLGRLEPDKNLAALLNLFALLCRSDSKSSDHAPQIRLRLIGDGRQRENLMRRANELGIAPWVEFCGTVPRERGKEAIQSCHVFCFTSITEGQCLASLEILAAGRPIIATSVGVFPETLTNAALGEAVSSCEPAVFLPALQNVLARQKAGLLSPQDTVRAYQAKFDGEAVLRKYVELLRPVAAIPERVSQKSAALTVSAEI